MGLQTRERIKLIDVRKSFDGKLVLDGISFTVGHGNSVMLIGPNACGKTTLLKIIGGILRPDSGNVIVDGVVSVVFQEDLLAPWMSLRDNIGLLLKLKGAPPSEIATAVDESLHLLRIEEYANLRPKESSGGTLRKVTIARALTLNPDILLLDEPLVELDSESRQSVVGILENLRLTRSITTVMTTHYPEELEDLADEAYFLTQRPTQIRSTRALGHGNK